MTLSQDRPAFVLPWIVVVLASFALLPPWMSKMLGEERGAEAEGSSLTSSEMPPAEAVGPPQLPATFEPGGLYSALSIEEIGMSLHEGVVAAEQAHGVAQEAAAPVGEVKPIEATLEGGEETAEDPAGSGPHEFHRLVKEDLPPRQTTTPLPRARVAAHDVSAGLASAGSAGSEAATTEALLHQAVPTAEGRHELVMRPQVLAYLVREGLLPRDVRLAPMSEADVQRRAPWEARRRAIEEAEREAKMNPYAGMTRREHIERKAKEFLLLLRSEPRKALRFLATMDRSQLRDLAKRLNERGLDPRAMFGI